MSRVCRKRIDDDAHWLGADAYVASDLSVCSAQFRNRAARFVNVHRIRLGQVHVRVQNLQIARTQFRNFTD